MSFRNHVNFQIHDFTEREKRNSQITQESDFTISRKEKTHFTISRNGKCHSRFHENLLPPPPSHHPTLNEYLVTQEKKLVLLLSVTFLWKLKTNNQSFNIIRTFKWFYAVRIKNSKTSRFQQIEKNNFQVLIICENKLSKAELYKPYFIKKLRSATMSLHFKFLHIFLSTFFLLQISSSITFT